MACILYSSGVLLQRQNHGKRPTWTIVHVYRSALHMADCANYSSFKTKKHIWEVLPNRITVPVSVFHVITVSLLRTNVINWVHCGVYFWSVDPQSVPTSFSWLAVIGFSWGTWIPTTWWVWCLKREWLGLFPLAFPTLFIVWDFFSMSFNLSYLRLISSWHSSLTIASKANSDQSSRYECIS